MRFWRDVLPLLAWMAFIFGMSTHAGSAEATSGTFNAIVDWLWPALPTSERGLLFYLWRKAGHLTEYAVLAMLAVRALRQGRPAWQWRTAGAAVLLSVLYAASDEWHQGFEPSRTSDWHDVLIDATGVILGIGIAWLWYRAKESSRRSALGARRETGPSLPRAER
jgi:VanZ family protein